MERNVEVAQVQWIKIKDKSRKIKVEEDEFFEFPSLEGLGVGF